MKCPHCGAPYYSTGQVFMHALGLLGPLAPLKCPRCQKLSYVSLSGRNAVLALAILVAAVVASVPSSISNSLFAGIKHPWSAIFRLEIWAISVLIAYSAFAFANPLQALYGDYRVSPRLGAWARVARFLFSALIVLWGYVLYRGLTNAP